ncbi:MAG: hypothetical protein EOO73_10370 [Myxococcales bacterium]|nr:MAG: hypothetical protein EOO73_10370 [Myxococcales bacterium]
MRTLGTWLLILFALPACAARSAALPSSARAPAPARQVSASTPPEPAPRDGLAQADLAYISQLGASRGGRFDTERQISQLERAVELYAQFLERAAGRPELASAVKKSQERLADARETIDFLKQSLNDEAKPR